MIFSRLKGFSEAKVRVEQYPTEPAIAAEVLWKAYMAGEIQEEAIADLGCGTGILGIGCLLLGSKRVFFVDIDPGALEICRSNLSWIKSEGYTIGQATLINCPVKEFNETVDLVIQNPPFGTKVKHADKEFLEKAMNLAPLIYSFHKSESKAFIRALSSEKGFQITEYFSFDFPIKQSMKHHTKRIQRIGVGCWKLEKIS